MTFDDILTQVLTLLRREGRVFYRALKRRFDLDEDYLEDLKAEIIQAKQLAVDEDGAVLVWSGEAAMTPVPVSDQERAPLSYTPAYLAEKILTSRAALEGERKQVTVLFADLKGSTELIEGLDPEEARRLLDPALHVMMDAVYRYEGTVNQVLGDGIMALFGAPVAHEDHAVRVCYAALAMQAAMRRYAEEVRRSHGLEMQARVGLNSGEVVVRAIANDLHMDYSAVGQTTHLAARMEQLATPGSIRLTAATLRLAEGLIQVSALGWCSRICTGLIRRRSPCLTTWLRACRLPASCCWSTIVRSTSTAGAARPITRDYGEKGDHMLWAEIRQAYPHQWLIIEALEAHTTPDKQRHLDCLAVIDTCPDGSTVARALS